jgi:hypothetical protein
MVSRLPPATLNALFRLAFATAPVLNTLALPRTSNSLAHYAKGTLSLADHPKAASLLQPFVSIRFQVYFTPFSRVLFTFPSRY